MFYRSDDPTQPAVSRRWTWRRVVSHPERPSSLTRFTAPPRMTWLFPAPARLPTPNKIWLKWRVLCSKNRYFSYCLIYRPPNIIILKIFRLRKFLLNSPLTLDVPGENTSISLSEPNKSDIVKRQIGGEKSKYVLKFRTGGTYHVISRHSSFFNFTKSLHYIITV